MQLLENYLAAVARHLPKAQAADITAELRDNLLSEIEEKEAGLGRKLNDKELERLLIDFGHPLTVAARYRQPRYLIGPEIYPFWLRTLQVVFLIVLAVAAVGSVIRLAIGDPAARIAADLPGVWPTVFSVFGVVTVIFAILERTWNGRMKLNWSPRSLPPPRATGPKPAELIGEMVMVGLFLLWWTGLVQFRAFVPIPPFVHVHMAPVWAQFYWPILAFAVSEIALNSLQLARPGWVRVNAGLGFAKQLWGLGMFYLILQAGHWVQVDAPTVTPFALDQMRHGFDRGMQFGITVTLAIMAFKTLQTAWRLIRGRARDGQANGGAASPAGAGVA
jgi:hypothetical protein